MNLQRADYYNIVFKCANKEGFTVIDSYYFRAKTIPLEQNYTFPFKVDNFI